jgi:diamine N-acetyltransferase
MTGIRYAAAGDVETINNLAHEIWWQTYSSILPEGQISLMLAKMYSVESLFSQIEAGVTFLMIESNAEGVGFASYSFEAKERLLKIHKLYILEKARGQGLGHKVISFILDEAHSLKADSIELNVNRNNPAYHFYLKCGFKVYAEVDVPYFGFVLNDYLLRLPVL